MITIRRMTAGSGFRYLMRSVAVGDGRADESSPLTRYYGESGTPPGRFVGAGLAGLGINVGQQVSEEHLYRMLVDVVDPATGKALGRQGVLHHPPSLDERVERRLGRLPEEEREAARERVETEERRRTDRLRAPVAGFDLTFSPSKSVSVAWALADQGTKAVIYECHLRALDYTLNWAERNVFRSRSGKNGVVTEDIEGAIAAAFTHYDTRSGDPQLHDHCVIFNRARSVSDGQWRTLDSRALFKAIVALSEIHQGVLADMLTSQLDVGWEAGATRGGMRKHEMAGVPEPLLSEFSRRREAIEDRRGELVAEFVATRGHEPTPVEWMRLNQRANLETRPDKLHRSLAEMSEDWRQRAVKHVGNNPVAWVSTLRDRNDLPLLRSDDLTDDMLAEVAELAVAWQAERRSTFSRMNVLAEAARQLEGVRFASPDDRVTAIERTTELALAAHTVQVTAPELHHVPGRYRRADGTSRLRPADHHLYTTAALLDAEARLFDAARHTDGPAVSVATIAKMAEKNLPGRDHPLSVDQAVAVEKIATSRRRLDVLVGPAGTGKSTAMAGLRAVWEAEHGQGSVIGLAPSATAAEVLADELGIDCENTAKWRSEHEWNRQRRTDLDELEAHLAKRKGRSPTPPSLLAAAKRLREAIERWELHSGQLVIVDEASLAGTFTLDELVEAAGQAGAKVLLAGDPQQLSAVDAGGMFRSLVRDRDDLAPELTDIRRFNHAWEKTASVGLRAGSEAAIDTYEKHGRILGGCRDDLLEDLYRSWKRDVETGRSSLMIAGDAATVAELNRRARADRVAVGQVKQEGLLVAGGQVAGVGDEVVTRENNRLLTTGRGWVKNGDGWIVSATNEDGSMRLRRTGGHGSVVLPATYVTEHLELAYATTAHRAQGRTVDTAHAMISPTTTREVLYVAATRGRDDNRVYVDTHYDPDPDTGHNETLEPQTARAVLAGVLAREGAELSATDTIRASYDATESIGQLSAEYLTIAREAQAERWDTLIANSGLTTDQITLARESDAYGPLVAAFGYAEARGLDPEAVFPKLVQSRRLDDAGDIASVLHARVDHWMEAAGSKRQAASDLIAGLIPRAKNVTDADMTRALAERDQAMERRAHALAERAVEQNTPWARLLGTPPDDPSLRTAWMHETRVVAAYRERWNITGLAPVDDREEAHSIEQVGHQKRARAAGRRALAISRHAHKQPHDHSPALESITVEPRTVER